MVWLITYAMLCIMLFLLRTKAGTQCKKNFRLSSVEQKDSAHYPHAMNTAHRLLPRWHHNSNGHVVGRAACFFIFTILQ